MGSRVKAVSTLVMMVALGSMALAQTHMTVTIRTESTGAKIPEVISSEGVPPNMTAYAVKGNGGRVYVTLININKDHGATVPRESVQVKVPAGSAVIVRLSQL